MRMGIFWGLVLVLLGLSLIINIVFHVDLPIFKILLAFLFIYIGVRILIGDGCGFRHRSAGSGGVVFGERTFRGLPRDGNKYDVVFGKAVIDLRDAVLPEKETRLQVDVVFGSAEVWLSKSIPVRIDADVVFGGAKLPDNDSGGFGSLGYTSENFDPNVKHLYLKAAAVFGGLVIQYR